MHQSASHRFSQGSSGFSRRKFSSDEDLQLRTLVESMGTRNWEKIAKFMGERTARQCRDRFKNYLVDSLVVDPWTPQEDALLIGHYHLIGPKWVEIGKLLSGRSGNNVKNRWHKHLCKIDQGGELSPSSPPQPREIEPIPMIHDNPPPQPQPLTIGDPDWVSLFHSIEMPASVDSAWSNGFSVEDSFI
jgi:hypothetical protein